MPDCDYCFCGSLLLAVVIGCLRANDRAGIGGLGEVCAATFVGGHSDGGDVRAEIEQEGVQARAQTHRAQDPKADPPQAPKEVLLYRLNVLK